MWFRRGRDPRIHDELQFHRDRLIDDYMAAGLSRADARRKAFLEFGSLAATEERVRDARGRWLDDLARDLRCGARSLRKSPVFAATTAGTLALGIGLSTAMVAVLSAAILRPVAYASPEQLVMVWTEDPAQNLREGRSGLGDVDQWRHQARSFTDVATFDGISTTLTTAEGAEQIAGGSISANLLPLLGVRPSQGRSFTVEEAEQNQALVVISHRFWQARFGASRSVLGTNIVLNGRPFEIVGVLPEGFQLGTLDADVWVPHATSGRGADTWFVIGRLRPEATFSLAQEELAGITSRLNAALPAAERNRGVNVVPLSLYLVRAETRVALWMLGGAVFLVFLIAVANVTSLSVARTVDRADEMAVRAALGAGAGRIVRQLLTESVMLSIVAGVLGTLLAAGGIRLVRTIGPATLPGLDDLVLDLRAALSALTLALTAGILVGLAPALATLRRAVRSPGAESGRRVSAGAATRAIRRTLVVAEFALSIVLLVGAGLLLRSWWHVTGIDQGFKPAGVLVMELSAPAAFRAPAQRSDLYHQVLEQIQAVPGVETAGIIGDLFISNTREQLVTIEGDAGTRSERVRLGGDEVSADFFTAAGAPLLRGRVFSSADGPGAARVAIVNAAMARQAWPGDDALGRRFKLGPLDSDRPWLTVVGVVADMRRQGPERNPIPQMFVPLAQNPPRSVDLLVRTSWADPLAMAGSLRAAVRRVEREAPVYGMAPLEQQLGYYVTQRRFQTVLLTVFAAVALLMAATGIYGLIQYSVAMRTQEIGVRQAIGAPRGGIFRMLVGEALTLCLMGLGIGLAGAWALGRAVSGLLVGITPADPWTFAAVSLVLVAVAVSASAFPARRATTVDPVVALRVS